MPSVLLPLDDAAACVALHITRFLELVGEGFYPPPINRDPDRPEWHRDELLAVLEAREGLRLEKMIRAGLLADCEPAPTCRRLETVERIGSAKAAGALHLLLQSRGGRAYRRGDRDYRVFLPAGRRQRTAVLRDLQVLCPQHEFQLIEETPPETGRKRRVKPASDADFLQ
jgi:hypothetical protein